MVNSATSLRVDFEKFWRNIFDVLNNNRNKESYDFEKAVIDSASIQVPISIIKYFSDDNYNIDLMFETWLYSIYAMVATNNNQNQYSEDLFDDDFFFLMEYKLVAADPNKSDEIKEKVNKAVKFGNRLELIRDKVVGSINFIQLKYSIDDINNLESKVKLSLEKQSELLEQKILETSTIIEENTERSLKEIKKKIKRQSQKSAESSITVLGIFVGVVMVFFGGFTILENAIESMQKSSMYRLYFTMLSFGGIMYNVVILLFFLISRIIEKPMTCRCYKLPSHDPSDAMSSQNIILEVSRNDCYNCQYRAHFRGICRVKHTLPYIYWGNAVIITGLIFIFFLKLFSSKSDPYNINLHQLIFSSVISLVVLSAFFIVGIVHKKPKSERNNIKDKRKQK